MTNTEAMQKRFSNNEIPMYNNNFGPRNSQNFNADSMGSFNFGPNRFMQNNNKFFDSPMIQPNFPR